jgi:ribosomal protein S18 acetylase RimI-like enzyme
MVLAPLKFGLPTFVRFMRVMTPLEHLHKANAPARHWYLQWLGVDPPRQGQGIGSALMQPVLARADADSLPCYLETANARTVFLYQRHGFEVVVEGDLPKGAPHFWTMMRAPRG